MLFRIAPAFLGQIQDPAVKAEFENLYACLQQQSRKQIPAANLPTLVSIGEGEGIKVEQSGNQFTISLRAGIVPIVVTEDLVIPSGWGVVVPERLEVSAGIELEIEGGALLEITGPVAGANFTAQGRLTLTSGLPVLVSAVTAATVVYYTPSEGAYVPVPDAITGVVIPRYFSELSQATTDTTKSPAACTTNSNYDYFVWDDAGTLRCTRGPAWTSDTARGNGVGTTDVGMVNGYLVNLNAITNGPGAFKGLYVGSIRTNGSSQVDFIPGGVGAAGGESTILGIWNMFNRKFISLVNYDTTVTWNYTTATWRLKNAGASATANRILFIIGWRGDGIDCINNTDITNTSTNIFTGNGIGLNSTSTPVTSSSIGVARATFTNAHESTVSFYRAAAPLGFNFVAPLEISTATGTTTWSGSNSANSQTSFCMSTMF